MPKFRTKKTGVQLLLTPEARELHLYEGPVKFRGTCANCEYQRNQHCGHCKGCPGWHDAECMKGFATGAWH